ncbi:MAG: glycosyltransferase family 2 protein [Verrucomicrobia bacterium]|nr:glycosyltransferase family 2 protein [Verrucomicrobiota bacterium]
MQVSVIIPLYNNLALTRACVDSLQATLPAGLAHEIILVDDGSTDGTRDWLATLVPPFRVVLNERNLGYAAANNRAAALAHGRFLALLNNDLVLLPGWLGPMLRAHASLLDAAGVIGNVQLDARSGAIDHTGIIINHQGKPVHDRALPSALSRFFTTIRRIPAVTGACLLLERKLWRQLGGFDEAFINGGEDVDLCFRALASGRTNAVALTSVIRHHVSSSAGRKLHDEQNSRRLARRWHREFIAHGSHALRQWCRDCVDRSLAEPRDCAPDLARRAWLYANHLSRTPPPEAVAALEAALDDEFRRWDRMFGADS